ncbi:hypothetical protein IFM89_015492 [Coptis chinensis]|uniref:F-box domain-containing protein n=1 Tax=Coptis chinensis TaxID=261450 RepID=A0A835GYB0_9MAGN|nr:hypothetical protein IFM89_015492 [Coptis chinensis]
MDRFPTDIITIILTYLPVKSVLRCRSVSKTWLAIIDSLQFPELHLNASTRSSNSSSFIILPTDFNEIYITNEDERFPRILETTKINLSFYQEADLIQDPSVHGLMFFSTWCRSYSKEAHNYISMYICNPATRDFVKLPNLNIPECTTSKLVSGLGFDTVRREFKVVQIFYQSWDVRISEVQVYTLGANSWRNLGRAPNVKFKKHFRAFVNGSVHWLAEDESEDGFRCLSVIDNFSAGHIEIWIMKEYNVKESWTRYVVSKLDVDGVLCETVQPILLRKNGEIVILYDRMELVSYNIGNGNFNAFEVHGLPGLPHETYKIFSYVETLTSLNAF